MCGGGGWGCSVTWGRGKGYVYPQAEPRRRNKMSSCLLTYKLRVYCPEVQHVEQILLTKYTLIAAVTSKDTHCAAGDYVGLEFIVTLMRTKVFSQSTLFLVVAFHADPGRSDSILHRLSVILAKGFPSI